MTIENVKKFYEALAKDPALQQKLTDIFQRYQSESIDPAAAARLVTKEILPLAEEYGTPFALDDLKRHEFNLWHAGASAQSSGELSEDELDDVTGGLPNAVLPAQGLFMQWINFF